MENGDGASGAGLGGMAFAMEVYLWHRDNSLPYSGRSARLLGVAAALGLCDE